MDYRYKGHGFNIEAKRTVDGKGWTFIANVHWVGGEEFTTYTSDKSFTSPQETQMEAIADTRKWIDSR
jgi:hypothetical protein